jgi:hypothetical protein
MEDSKSDHYVSMSWKQCHKTRNILKVFLKGSTWKFTWNDLQIPCIGVYSGHNGKLGFWEFDARVELILSTKRGLAKDWERPTKRAIAVTQHTTACVVCKSLT